MISTDATSESKERYQNGQYTTVYNHYRYGTTATFPPSPNSALRKNSKNTRRPKRKRTSVAANPSVDEASLLQGKISRLEPPSTAAVKACRIALLGAEGNDAILSGGARRMSDTEFMQDLEVLAPNTATDALSQVLKDHWKFSDNAAKVSACP